MQSASRSSSRTSRRERDLVHTSRHHTAACAQMGQSPSVHALRVYTGRADRDGKDDSRVRRTLHACSQRRHASMHVRQ